MKGHPLFARLCDHLMKPLEPLRAPTVAGAVGAVLEIGFGTGLNLLHYGRDVRSLDAVEPDPYMCERARRRLPHASFPVVLHQADAQNLPFEAQHFDTVVCTWTLCTVPYPERALREILRVLKPNGKLLYAEHIAADFPIERALQHVLNPIWRQCAAGCQLNRNTVATIRAAGFEPVVDTPRGWRRFNLVPVNTGTAVKPAGRNS